MSDDLTKPTPWGEGISYLTDQRDGYRVPFYRWLNRGEFTRSPSPKPEEGKA